MNGAEPSTRPSILGRAAEMRGAWIVILLLALVPRLALLAARPVWYDEAFAALFSARGPAAMLYGTLAEQSGVAADVHPIFYYTLLWGWQNLFGSGPLAIRSLSVLLGLASVLLGYRLAADLFGKRTAFAAGLLIALAPFQVHYSQEARMYALLCALVLGAALAFRRALAGAGWGAWLCFSVLAGAAQYAHNLAFVHLVPLALTSLPTRKPKMVAATVLAGLGSCLLYLPWLIRLPSQLARVEWAYWIPPPGPAELVQTGLTFLSGLPLPKWGLPLALGAVLLVLTSATMATARAVLDRHPQAGPAAWTAWLAGGPILVMFVVSLWRPVYLDRALLPAGVLALLWIAWALSAGPIGRPLRVTGWAALAVAFSLGLAGFYSYRGFPYAPFDEMDATLRQRRSPAEVVLHSNKISALPAVYADPGLEQRLLADPARSASDTLAPATQAVLGLLASPDPASAVGDAPGVWFVMFDREQEDYRAEGIDEHPALAWLEQRFDLAESVSLGELTVYHFVR